MGEIALTRRTWIASAIVAVPLLAYPLVSLAGGAPRFPTRNECARPVAAGHPVALVWGREDDPVSANELRDHVISVGFKGTESVPDGCGRWKVVLDRLPSVEIAQDVEKEGLTVDLHPSIERGSDS